MEEVVQLIDPLDAPEFSSVDYINRLFPTEQSLSNMDDVIAQLECKIHNIDDKIGTLVKEQTTARAEEQGRGVLLDAQQVICQLIQHISEIKNTAEESEETVKEIIHDIKQLDCAKRNLTTAINTLNHLQILVRGLDSIKALTKQRLYSDLVGPLQGVLEVMKYLQRFTGISNVNKLINEFDQIEETLSQQIKQDFCKAVIGGGNNFIPTKSPTDICLIIDILNPKIKRELLKWFTERQMDEYLLLFNENEENSWLDKVDCRYTWFKKHLIQFEKKFGYMFPCEWKVSERITITFCQVTKTELTNIMARRAKEIDVKVLLYAFQKTSSFEQLLATRFSGNTLLEDRNDIPLTDKTKENKEVPSKSVNITSQRPVSNLFDLEYDYDKIKEIKPTNQKGSSNFHNIIGESFIPYLYIFIESLDNSLYDMIEKIVADLRLDFSSIGNQNILPSCADLFVFYKKCLIQCSQLSMGSPMLSLSRTFGKYLREYALKVLQNSLPKLGGSSCSNSLTSVTTIAGREARLSRAKTNKICCILITAEYCVETTKQLEEKLKMKIDPFLADKLSLSQEQDVFLGVISDCIHLLVSDLESECQTALSAMIKIQWQSLETAGDQSGYVTTIISHLKASVPFIKENLSSSRKYFIQLCIKFSKSFITRFIESLYKCKPLSVIGAEQLLLDTQTLKTTLLELPSIGFQVNRKGPDCYNQIVTTSMGYGEKILKLVMTPNKPEARFVDQFLNLLPDSNIQEFQTILDMKGLRATEKSNLLSVFYIHHSTGYVVDSAMNMSSQND